MKSTASPQSWQYLLREAVLILVFSFFLLLTGTTPLLLEKPIWLMAAGLVVTFSLLWLAVGQCAATPLTRPLAIFLLAFALSTAFSIDPRRSLTQFILTLAGVLLFSLSAEVVLRGWTLDLLVKCLLIAAAMEVLVILVPVVGWYTQWLQVEPGRWLPAINYRPALANIMVMFGNVILFLAAARLAVTRRVANRLVTGLLAVLLVLVIFLTSSRGGWLGTAAGGLVLAWLGAKCSGVSFSSLRAYARSHPIFTSMLLLVGLVVLAGAGWLALRQLAHPTHGSALLSRSEYWPAAWKTFLQHPLFGQGPYTYASAFLAENSVPPKYLFIHGHSVILNTLAEMGVVGLLAFSGLVFFLVRELWQRWQQARGMDRALVAGAFAGLTAVAAQSLFDCFHTDPLGILPLVIVLGAALAQPGPVPQARRGRPWWVLVLVGLVGFEVWTVLPVYDGATAANRPDFPAAEAAFSTAIRRDPTAAINHQQLALLGSLRAEVGDLQALDMAIAEMRQAIRFEPAWGPSYANLGALLAQKGDLEGARLEFEQAAARAPRWYLPYLNLGLLAEQRGDPSAAQEAYRQMLEVSADARESLFWQSSPLRQAAFATWQNGTGPKTAAPSLEDLRAQVNTFPQITRPYLLLAQEEIRLDQYLEAEHHLSLAGLTWLSAADRLEMEWLRAECLAGQENLEEAIQSGERTLQAYLSGGLFGPGTFGQLRYAPFMFRRPAMALELVPQLAQLPPSTRWEARMRQLEDWMRADGQTAAANTISAMRQKHLRVIFPGQVQ